MPFLQDLLHKFEVGGGMRHLRAGLAVVAVVLLTVGYNWRAYRNMATQEAMDTAQLGRNIAQGKGYTTLFVRPFSICLVKQRNQERQTAPEAGKIRDLAQLRGMHPDLANPPVYPVVLAALMKVLPFDYTVSITKRFWSNGGRFCRSSLISSLPCSISFSCWGALCWCSFWPGGSLTPEWPGSRPAWCWGRNCSGDSACRVCPQCC